MIKMEYAGFGFPVNPSSLKIKYTKNIRSKTVPFSFCRVREINDYPTVVTADGKFVGEKAMQFSYTLMRVYKRKGSSWLLMPDSVPVKAYFKSLNLSYDAKNNCVHYQVEFVEDAGAKKENYDFGYTYARRGENAFDIANRTNTDLETIVGRNDFPDLFSLKEGEKIWLR